MRTAVQIAAVLTLAGALGGCGWLFGPSRPPQAASQAAPASQDLPASAYEPAPVPPRELIERQP